MTKRRSFSDKFKATVALEALRGDKTAQEIAADGARDCSQAQGLSNAGDSVETADD